MTNYDIKTLVFDLGGVFFTRGTNLAIEKIFDLYDIENHHLLREFFRDGYKTEGQWIRLGIITMDEFEKKLIENFNIREDEIHHVRRIWFGSYVPYYGMEELINELGKKYRLVIFSGNIRERIDFLDNRYHFLEKFDDYVFSFDYKKNKGEIGFYKELLNHLDCEPSEAILIDDEKQKINMARSLGINGIHFYYTEKLIKDFQKFNIFI